MTKNELDKLTEYIEYGVRCAEMYFDTTDGKAKKQYVLNYVIGVLDNLVDVELTEENTGSWSLITKNNEKMAFMSISDEEDTIEIILSKY